MGIQSKGRSISGLTTKLHLCISENFGVIEGFLSDGNRSDILYGNELIKNIRGCYIIADKGYDSDMYRQSIISKNNIPVIPGRKNRKEKVYYDRERFAIRKKIEQFFGMLKENRRLGLRFEKSDIAFLGFIALAVIKHHLC